MMAAQQQSQAQQAQAQAMATVAALAAAAQVRERRGEERGEDRKGATRIPSLLTLPRVAGLSPASPKPGPRPGGSHDMMCGGRTSHSWPLVPATPGGET